MSPFVVLIIGVAVVVVGVIFLRLHAFLALILAAVLVGILSPVPLVEGDGRSQAVTAIEETASEFGHTAAGIGIVIVLASIIGKCLMDSGAADVITRRFLRLLGVERAPLALLSSGYLLSIPVFFDTVFYLLVPLARALRMRTGKDYVLYIMAICLGAGLTHSLVAPTPGPLIMADNLKLDLGVTILAGIAFSLLPGLLGGWFYARWLNARMEIPLRELPGATTSDLISIAERKDAELPAFWLSALPIALPVLLISGDTIVKTLQASSVGVSPGLDTWLRDAIAFVGNRNTALFVSMTVAVAILLRQRRWTLRRLSASLEPAIASAGIIILITSAGGAFGAMLRRSGIGDALQQSVPADASGAVLILVAFSIASVMKIAQGSGTVAMITASSMVYGVVQGQPLPFHPVYLFLAVGFGSMVFSWMNDSGFWIVAKMSGSTEAEAFKTWSVGLALLGFLGLVEVLLFSFFIPLNFLP